MPGSTIETRRKPSARPEMGLPATAHQQELAEFMSKYKINILDTGKIRFTLPAGTSRVDFLKEAQDLGKNVHNLGPVDHVVYPQLFHALSNIPQFSTPIEKDLALTINGNVPGINNKNAVKQNEHLSRLGLMAASTENAIVAYAAYFVATGQDMFARNVVRTSWGLIWAGPGGIGGCGGILPDPFPAPYSWDQHASRENLGMVAEVP